MKTDKEVFEALLAGEILLGQGCEYKLEKGVLMINVIDEWKPSTYGCPHHSNVEIKKRTININGFEVPEPLSVAPKEGTTVFTPAFDEDLFMEYDYFHAGICNDFLRKGVLHLTEEAAIAHAQALLSFTKKEEE